MQTDTKMCGYWTFVPIFREVCGTRTFGDDCTKAPKTTHNFCGLELSKQPGVYPWGLNNAVEGETMFVQTDCTTHLPLDTSMIKGSTNISNPYEISMDYANFWRQSTIGTVQSVNKTLTTCILPMGAPKAADCFRAIGNLANGGNPSPRWVANPKDKPKPGSEALYSVSKPCHH